MRLIFFRPGALQRLTAEEIMLEVRANGETVALLVPSKIYQNKLELCLTF